MKQQYSPEDEKDLEKIVIGNIQMYVILLIWAIIGFGLFFFKYHQEEFQQTKNPEAVTSGHIHNN